jgi:hypothetical protein
MKTKYKCLYEITGRIEDVATFLVPINELPQQRKPLITDKDRENVFAEAEKLMGADDNLSWRIAILMATEAAHGIKE